MNVKVHVSAGQISNQGGLPQQNGKPMPLNQMQNLVGSAAGITDGGVTLQHNMFNVDPDLLRARGFMRERIFGMLHCQTQTIDDTQRTKFRDISKRLEEGLFKAALTKEDFVNMDTLEHRLSRLIEGIAGSNNNQRHQQLVNSSSSIGAVIPTPGMSHTGNSSLVATSSLNSSTIVASGCNSVAPTVTSGSLMSTGGMQNNSNNRYDGSLSNGYQQSAASYSIGSGVNMQSLGVQRIASQTIPTPGFNSNSNQNNSISNQSYMSLESSNNFGGFSAVESTMVPQLQQQKQPLGGQNSHRLHNLGSHMGSGIRSSLQHKSHGFPNGSLIGGLGVFGNNLLVNEHSTSEGYLTGSQYANSPRSLQQHFDHQRPMMLGDGYGMSNSDSHGSWNFNGAVTPVGSITNSPNMNSASSHSMSMSKTDATLTCNQSNLHGAAQATQVSGAICEKMNFHSPLLARDNLLQSNQQQQLHHFQQHQQFVQHPHQQKLQNQPQPLHLLNNDINGHSQVMSDMISPMDQHTEVINSEIPDRFQLPKSRNQFQVTSPEDQSGGAHHLSASSDQHDICLSLTQISQPTQQMLHSHHLISESNNNLNCYSLGAQPELVPQGQWYSQSQEKTHMVRNMSHEHHVREDFRQRNSAQGEAHRNYLSSKGSVVGQSFDPRIMAAHPNSRGASCRSANKNRDGQFRNQQRWLLFLRHARRCAAPEGKCQDVNCITVQKLWRHMDNCSSSQCSYSRCHHSKILIHHDKHCRDPSCPVCVPVKNYLQQQKERARPFTDSRLPSSVSESCKSCETGVALAGMISKTPSVVVTAEDLQPSLKRTKIEASSQSHAAEGKSFAVSTSAMSETRLSQDVQQHDYRNIKMGMPMKSEFMEVKMEAPVCSGQVSPRINVMKDNIVENDNQKPDVEPIIYDEPTALRKQVNSLVDKEMDVDKQESVAHPAETASVTKCGKPKIKGVSLIELFTPEQVREHIFGLRQWVGQSKAKTEKNQAMEHLMSENSCQLCAVEKLTFEPPPLYCSPCGARIKRNAMYYTVGAGDTRHYFCIPCYNEGRGDTIVFDGTTIAKAKLEKKKNDEETEEWWVQCDKCEAWQHQICALFNGRRNDGGQAEYTCPNCYITEVERGERKPLLQSAVLGAKDLPRTILSDHIEQRLFKRLKHERLERARVQGKSYDEVPGAEALVVRVVSSVDKKLEVKQRFLEIFQEENYPTEFPYKSKVVLLFQKIEGVEVCLFGMYVQEFGSECQFPNQRRVYLSYLDSVKYFRPEIKAVTGEALRTFVYHEILIGYLEYCKLRGFTSCYIWACPPLKGEDYILYCHPEIQKTPKSDKLREWYLSMLRKASRENIVVDLVNLYDHFFVSTGERRAKVTASRLPYFDGDYWPGAAEDLIYQIRQEEDGKRLNKKGSTKKPITKRALKASGQTDLSGNASKDLLLMHKLGETISPMKEDFIMVHLQHACKHCCMLMVTGSRHVCKQCKNFQLCDKCFEVEKKREDRERHPTNSREVHLLQEVPVTDVTADTKDKDEILESEFFDTRQAFLSLCQGNHYQYDTLRRAKHSSMMVLYHLHNPTAPAFVTTCCICHLDIESGQGWRCEVCPDYDVCNACYRNDGGIGHPHKLTTHLSTADRDAQNKEARQLRVLQLRKMLDLLVHASQCRSPHCQYPNCRKVKGLFRHGRQCKTRASGGCVLCKKMWYLLQLHARACKQSECHVPRCRDLKEHLRRLQQQSDSRRRAAVMEMMRQRAAEVAGNAG